MFGGSALRRNQEEHLMKIRHMIAAGVVVIGTAIPAGGSFAASGSGSGGGGRTDVRIISTCNVAAPCSAGAAGTVSVSRSGANLTVTATRANAGWSVQVVRRTGLNPEVEFRNGSTRITFEAQVDNGAVKTSVRTRTR
jgi:hypothetical protein